MFNAVHVPHLNEMPHVFDIPMVPRYVPNISMMHCLMSVSPQPFSCRAHLEAHHDMMPWRFIVYKAWNQCQVKGSTSGCVWKMVRIPLKLLFSLEPWWPIKFWGSQFSEKVAILKDWHLKKISMAQYCLIGRCNQPTSSLNLWKHQTERSSPHKASSFPQSLILGTKPDPKSFEVKILIPMIHLGLGISHILSRTACITSWAIRLLTSHHTIEITNFTWRMW